MQSHAIAIAPLFAALLATLSLAACDGTSQDEPRTVAPPSYRDDVAPILAAKCASCHSGDAAAAGWRATSYVDAIGCTANGTAVTVAADGVAPIVAVLHDATHAGLATDADASVLSRWVAAGTPAFRGGVHDPSFVDPRSPQSHDKFLRSKRWKPMLDATDPDACGRCHEGAPARPSPAPSAAPGATPCTSCHTAKEGPLACNTCHGNEQKPYPPRDACFFPDAKQTVTHAAHVEGSASKASGFACSTCHPTPTTGDFTNTHGDGTVEVWFDYARAGAAAKYDAATGACSVQCHAGPDAKRPQPAWTDTNKVVCGDCHGVPPSKHYLGPCNLCHHETDATGSKLVATSMHMNGKIDLGDGSGKCGACHGTGDDPWPTTNAHPRHKSPASSKPLDCTTCHEVPKPGDKHPLGLGAAQVHLAGLSTANGRAPSYDATTKSCGSTYCHDQNGGSARTPVWTTKGAGDCGGCHSIPPGAPHTTNTSCGTTGCHLGAVSGGAITPEWAPKHVNGNIELGP